MVRRGAQPNLAVTSWRADMERTQNVRMRVPTRQRGNQRNVQAYANNPSMGSAM